MFAANVSIAGQGVIYQYGVAAVGSEGAGGFVPYINLFQTSAAVKSQRLWQAEILRNGYQCILSFDFSTSDDV